MVMKHALAKGTVLSAVEEAAETVSDIRKEFEDDLNNSIAITDFLDSLNSAFNSLEAAQTLTELEDLFDISITFEVCIYEFPEKVRRKDLLISSLAGIVYISAEKEELMGELPDMLHDLATEFFQHVNDAIEVLTELNFPVK